MKKIFASVDAEIPKGVKVQLAGRKVTVTGPRGTLTKDFSHLKLELKLKEKGRKIQAEQWFGNRAQTACLRTCITHIKNMFTGVTKGFLYKMKIVTAHFPMEITTNENTIEIRNFLGEKYTRTVKIPEGVTFVRPDPKVAKDELYFSGNDVEKVAQTCAGLFGVCRVTDKDIRKFLDGIYVFQKTHVQE